MTVTAERGTLSQDGEELFLYDNVVLVRDASAEHSESSHAHQLPAHGTRALA